MKNENLHPMVVGVDLGATKAKIAAVDASDTIIDHIEIPTNTTRSANEIIFALSSAIQSLQARLPSYTLTTAGVATAGQIDPDTGSVIFAPNLNWKNVPLAFSLKQQLNIPITIANDVRSATVGEMYFGAGRNRKNFICIFIGTGIGGGIVLNGRLVEGNNNSAGEIGHMVIDMNGPLCTCGNRGCFEAIAGGWAIEKQAKDAIRKHPHRSQAVLAYADNNVDKLLPSHLFKAARNGDPFAKDLIDHVLEALGVGTATLANVLNPECIILGGGIVDREPWLVDAIKTKVSMKALPSARVHLQIVTAEKGADAPILGIVKMAKNKLRNE